MLGGSASKDDVRQFQYPHPSFAIGLDRNPVALAGAGRITTPSLTASSIGIRHRGAGT